MNKNKLRHTLFLFGGGFGQVFFFVKAKESGYNEAKELHAALQPQVPDLCPRETQWQEKTPCQQEETLSWIRLLLGTILLKACLS